MYKLTYKTEIACAHQLKDTESLTTKKCLRVHGHQWEVFVVIQTKSPLKDGMIIDFGEIKETINQFDHRNLNDFFENPTAENIANRIYDLIKEKLFKRLNNFTLEITVWESPNASITYYESF